MAILNYSLFFHLHAHIDFDACFLYTCRLGGECLVVAQNLYGVSWFIGRELNMVLGFQLSFSRVVSICFEIFHRRWLLSSWRFNALSTIVKSQGSTTNMYVMEPLYKFVGAQTGLSGHKLLGTILFYGKFWLVHPFSWHWHLTIYAATTTCVLSLLCATICFILDKRASKLLKKDDVKTGTPLLLLLIPVAHLLVPFSNTCSLMNYAGEVIKITDVKYFPMTFWFISLLCVTYYVAVFPFISLGA